MKAARSKKINEFCRLSNYRVPGVTGHWNRTRRQKKNVCYSPRKRSEMTKFMSFADSQITVYRGSQAVEIVPGAKKTVCYSPWKWPEMIKFTSFDDFQITVYRGSRALKSSPESKPCAPMKTSRSDKIHEFYRLSNYRVPGVMGRWNRPRSQNNAL